MKYTVIDIEHKNNAWTARVGKYKDCFCDFEKSSVTIKIFQNKRPTREQFIEVYKRVIL